MARGLVRAAAPQLQEAFGGFKFFLQLAGCEETYEKMYL